MSKIERYCAYQERCEPEVRQKIKTLKVPENNVEEIIQYLKEEDFLNENRFTENFIRGKINAKQWGKIKIRAHLSQKGIAISVVNQYLDKVKEIDYQENLQKNIQKWIRVHGEIDRENYPKLYRHLLSKGYESGEISKKLKTFTSKS
ncbi:MAG: regulatory protein RecX [Bacteroidales bacterium]